MNVCYPALPPGHVPAITVEKARRIGYWIAYDEKGYEYIVGCYVVHGEDGQVAYRVKTDCYGNETRSYPQMPTTAE